MGAGNQQNMDEQPVSNLRRLLPAQRQMPYSNYGVGNNLGSILSELSKQPMASPQGPMMQQTQAMNTAVPEQSATPMTYPNQLQAIKPPEQPQRVMPQPQMPKDQSPGVIGKGDTLESIQNRFAAGKAKRQNMLQNPNYSNMGIYAPTRAPKFNSGMITPVKRFGY